MIPANALPEHITLTIQTNQQAAQCFEVFRQQQPAIGALDTETTGLHIIHDLPFLFQFGWIEPKTMKIYTFAVDLERQPILGHQVVRAYREAAKQQEKLLGHNLKFDLHMLTNFGEPFSHENFSDTMFYIRLAHPAVTPDKGGPPLKLKDYCAQFITRDAAYHERLLDLEKTKIVKILNRRLVERLGRPWTVGKVNDFFKDKINTADELPTASREAYNHWLNEDVPIQMRDRIVGQVVADNIPYNLLPRDMVITYGHKDIYLTLLIYLTTYQYVTSHHNDAALRTEEQLIMPLYEMERTGFDADAAYLEESRVRTRNYILQCRERFTQMAGTQIKTGQHELIKQLAWSRFGVNLPSTEDSIMEQTMNALDPGHPIIPWLRQLQELRTLEKWYSVYIIRFQKMLDKENKLYTTINQVGTVTGRVTSDFQQFPKSGITTRDGETLFTPRQLVIIPDDPEYDGIVYLDYSQIELRLQAIYTILVGHPEPNLYLAYGPLNCYHKTLGKYDYNNPEHIKAWSQEWYKDPEFTERWTPTDIHAATTCIAFNITPDDPDFKKYRSIGKTINFAKNYGAQRTRIRFMFPDASEEDVDRINNSYYLAFPGVKYYHDYCYRLMDYQEYATNLFGVRYYKVSGHNLINMLVQGSGAYLLKWKIRQIYDYSKAHNVKSKLQMNIHDELSWVKHKTEFEIFFEFKQIMETWEETIIPIVAEMDATKTTWAAKKGIENIEELRKFYENGEL